MRRLHDKVNIIPLIAKADTLTPDECREFKKTVSTSTLLIMNVYYKLGFKGTATLMITMFYMKDLNKPCILIPVSSKSIDTSLSLLKHFPYV